MLQSRFLHFRQRELFQAWNLVNGAESTIKGVGSDIEGVWSVVKRVESIMEGRVESLV